MPACIICVEIEDAKHVKDGTSVEYARIVYLPGIPREDERISIVGIADTLRETCESGKEISLPFTVHEVYWLDDLKAPVIHCLVDADSREDTEILTDAFKNGGWTLIGNGDLREIRKIFKDKV